MRKMQLDELILRWKKTTRALKIYEQEYGKTLTECLEKRTDAELVHFHDPVEAAAFFCLIELMKKPYNNFLAMFLKNAYQSSIKKRY